MRLAMVWCKGYLGAGVFGPTLVCATLIGWVVYHNRHFAAFGLGATICFLLLSVWLARKKLCLIPLGFSFILLLTIVGQLDFFGYFPPLTNNYRTSFARLNRAISYLDPRFSWDENGKPYQTYLTQIEQCQTSSDYHRLIQSYLVELNRGGNRLSESPILEPTISVGQVRRIEEQAVVVKVHPNLDVIGLQPGAVILTRDGLSVKAYLDKKRQEISYSTGNQQLYRLYNSLLAIPPQGSTISYRAVDGIERVTTINRDGDPEQHRIISQHLDDNIGYLGLTTLDQLNIFHFDQALDTLTSVSGLVIDLRNTEGKDIGVVTAILGRFIDKERIIGTEEFPTRLPHFGWIKQIEHRVVPRHKTYQQPVVVLVNHGTTGSAEILAAAFADLKRGNVVGTVTAGSYGRRVSFRIPGGIVSLQTGEYLRLGEQSLEGKGVIPRIRVHWSREDLYRGVDTELKIAQRYLYELMMESQEPNQGLNRR